jgi:hypothetical protein
MKPPLDIRPVTDEERAALAAGLHSHEAFTVRRCHIVLASAERQTPSAIAKTWRGAPPTVRHVRHACAARGLACVRRGSNVPVTVEPGLNAATREQGRAIRHQSPRTVGQSVSGWTLRRRAEVGHEQGLRETTRSCPTMRAALVRLGLSWPRATHGMVRPDPAYASKKPPGSTPPNGRPPSGPGAGLRR